MLRRVRTHSNYLWKKILLGLWRFDGLLSKLSDHCFMIRGHLESGKYLFSKLIFSLLSQLLVNLLIFIKLICGSIRLH